MCTRKTTSQFKEEVISLGKGHYKLCSKYFNSHTKVKILHVDCGTTYLVEPTAFLQGNRCPYCYGKHKLTNKQFIQLIEKLVGSEYTFVDSYVNVHTKLQCRHNVCGYVWYVSPDKFLYKGTRCPKCAREIRIKKAIVSKSKVLNQLKKLVGNNYQLFFYYQKTGKAVYYHTDCGHFFIMRPEDFEHGQRCPYCAEILRHIHKTKTNEDYIKDVNAVWHGKVKPIELYRGSSVKIKHRCMICGHVWKSLPTTILGGFGCSKCKYSKGELAVSDTLDTLKIEYDSPKTYTDLINPNTNGHLRYDFYLPKYNLVIEYQGIQHYQPVKFFGGLTRFKKQVSEDYTKIIYAIDNDIRFLSIKYTSLNKVDNIIKKVLNSQHRIFLNQ